jgi:hypothetical protein
MELMKPSTRVQETMAKVTSLLKALAVPKNNENKRDKNYLCA